MNTEMKYRPRSIDEFVFESDAMEKKIRCYAEGRNVKPLVLFGPNGTGKSLLGELIPKSIEGDEVIINKVNAESLNNKRQVREMFSRAKTFDDLYSINGQKMGYTVVEEVNFDPGARDALRTCLDEMLGRELFVFTTNEIEKIDRGLLSRAIQIEVLPLKPERFFNRAQHILNSEGVYLDDEVVLDVLQKVHSVRPDNRKYYEALDELVEGKNQLLKKEVQHAC